MIPYALIIDEFFADFACVRDFAESRPFQSHLNPADGITYPAVSPIDLESPIALEVGQRLVRIMSARVAMRELVLRMSPKGLAQPYSAHSDFFMGGSFTAVIYLNRAEHCEGGTELLSHYSGANRCYAAQPLDDELMCESDQPQAWRVDLAVPMAPNRAVIFPSSLIHRSTPIEGFGTDVHDARLIMAAVFGLAQ